MYSLIVAEDCDHYHMKQICTTTKKFSDLSYCIKLHCVEHSFVNDKTNDNSKYPQYQCTVVKKVGSP